MENKIRENIEAMERYIADNCSRIDKLNAQKEEFYSRIEELQSKCNHDFEDDSHMIVDKTCKICGYWEVGV